jgi:hypothetical protein
MRDLVDRGVSVGMSVVVWYLVVLVVGLSAIVFIGAAASLTNASSFDVSVGPVPLMSFWRSGASWGFSSGWGIAFLAPIGAVAGLALGIRDQLAGARGS